MVGDRERIAIALIAELELALIVGAPQLIRSEARRQRCSFCAGSRALQARDQPVPIQDRMNSAAGWHLHYRRQAPQQALTNLAGAPTRLLALGRHNGSFNLFR